MSAIAAIVTNRFAVMAAESGTSPGIKTAGNCQKIFLLADGSLLGCSGEIGTIRKFVKDWNNYGTFDAIPNTQWISSEIDALVVNIQLKMFEITGPHSLVPQPTPGYCATGSGGDVALGVLYTLLNDRDMNNLSRRKAFAIARHAVKAACDLVDGCRGPIRIRTITLP